LRTKETSQKQQIEMVLMEDVVINVMKNGVLLKKNAKLGSIIIKTTNIAWNFDFTAGRISGRELKYEGPEDEFNALCKRNFNTLNHLLSPNVPDALFDKLCEIQFEICVRLQELWRTRVADLGPLPQYIELAVIENMKYDTTDTTYSHITYYKELAFLGEEYRNELEHQALYKSLDEYDKQHNKNRQISLDEFKDNFRAARVREASCRHDPHTGMFPYEHEHPSANPNMWHVAWRMSHAFFKHRKLLYTHEEPAEFAYTGEPLWEDVAESAPGEPPQAHARSQKEKATSSDKSAARPPGPPRTGGKIKRVLGGHTSSEDEESPRPHDAGSSSSKYQKSTETGNYARVHPKPLHPREPPKATIPYPQSKPTTKADGRRKPPPPADPEVILITDSDEEQGKADEMETDDNPRPEVKLITDSEEQAAGSRAPPTEDATAAARLARMSDGRLSYAPRAPHAPQDGAKSRASQPSPPTPPRPSADAWLADTSAEADAAKAAAAARRAARRQRARNSNGGSSRPQEADISEMLRQLKIYCS
jgi:hypothetical protein